MKKIINYKNKSIYYTNINYDELWFEKLPEGKWAGSVYGDEIDKEIIINVAEKCIEKNINYACSMGSSSELIHDIFDEIEIGINVGNEGKDGHHELFIPTTWHEKDEFDDGVFFVLECTTDENLEEFEQIVFINLNKEDIKDNLILAIENLDAMYGKYH